MTNILIHTTQNKHVAVTYFVDQLSVEEIQAQAKELLEPETEHIVKTVKDLPKCGILSDAWVILGDRVVVDMPLARDVAHEIRRSYRDKLFAPHDDIIMKQIPGESGEKAEQARVKIREQDAELQKKIDACDKPGKLMQIINNWK